MIRVSLLCLAYFTIVLAVDDVTTIPVCEIKYLCNVNLNFSNMELESIQKSNFSSPGVRCLNLARNRISRLEKGAFDGLPELSYLNLARNPVSFEDFMKLSLPSLRALVLDGPFIDQKGSNIDNEQHDPSSAYYTHRDRWVTNNRLFQIHPISLPSLEELSFNNYKAKPISTWFDYFIVPNLTHLYIAKNNLTEDILPESFTESLTHLNMDDNQISSFAKNFPKLRYLSMDRNQIDNVCNENCRGQFLSVRDIPMLEYLSLVGNKITTIKKESFENSFNLRFLDLAMNQIRYLPWQVFDGTPNLKNLSLAQNALSEIPEVCWLDQLEVLSLKRNQISIINDHSFCGSTNLSSIDISHNGLTSVPSGTFERISGLTILDLSWNKITVISKNWITSGQVLHYLNLDGNLFENTDSMSLDSIGKLDTLSIRHNPLKMVSVGSLAAVQPDMKIDVSHVYDSELHKP